MKVPRIKRHPTTWIEVLQPHLRRFNLAHKLGSNVITNPEGCKNMHELLTMMGNRLDYARELERAVILAQDENGFMEAKNLVYKQMEMQKKRKRLDNLS